MALPPTRFVLDRVLPEPGEGPSEELIRDGYYKIEVHTRTPAGERWVARVEAKGDPGYGATRGLLGESALCLALDSAELPDRAGVLTPATAMGGALVERLRAAGQTFEVSRSWRLGHQVAERAAHDLVPGRGVGDSLEPVAQVDRSRGLPPPRPP